MKSPNRKRISDAKAGVLIVDQVKPAIPKRTAVRFDPFKGKCVKGASIFRIDLNDQLVLIASFLSRTRLASSVSWQSLPTLHPGCSFHPKQAGNFRR